MHGIEAAYSCREDSCFGSTCYNDVGFSQTDIVECISYSVRRRRTCRSSGEVRSVEAVHDRNLSGCNICNHFRNKERIEFRSEVVFSLFVTSDFFFESMNTSDSDTENHSDFVQIFFFYVDTGISYRFFSCNYGILSVKVHLTGFLTVNMVSSVEVLHFASELSLKF